MSDRLDSAHTYSPETLYLHYVENKSKHHARITMLHGQLAARAKHHKSRRPIHH